MQTTRLIVGLGNPGRGYADHRHNVGFMVLDELAHRRRMSFAVADPAWAEATDDRAGLVLLKPLTFMNLSGEAVAAWREGRLPPDAGTALVVLPLPLVVCDDLALPLGSVRLRAGGSSGGQNGLASIIDHLGDGDFPRLRLGIAPLEHEVDPADWPDFVLSPFTAAEGDEARDMVIHAADALEFWLAEGLDATVSRFNRRVRREDPQ
ncbi:aminoacyl-tRNA hydrolase [bacterium]|nr:MAG: aminoacyl-tRNA hydrolase [bacterium]